MGDRRQSSAKIFINSADKKNWVSPDSNTRLNVPIDPFILYNQDPATFTLGLESLSLPLAINMVNTKNNKLEIDGNLVVLPEGNYTVLNLIDTLNNELTRLEITEDYIFSYNETNNKITLLKYNSTTAITIGTQTRAYKILGIAENENTRGIQVGDNIVYQFEYLVNLVTTSGIIVRLLNFQTDNRGSNGNGGTTLTRVPINTQPYRYLSYFIETPFYTAIQNRHISNIEIELCNDDYSQLDLVGNPDYFITLRLDYAEPKYFNHATRTTIQTLREKK